MNIRLFVFAVVSICNSSLPSFADESFGIPACDEFFSKYEACVRDKVPADQRDSMKVPLEMLKAQLAKAIAKSGSSGAAAYCGMMKMQLTHGRSGISNYGCEF